MSLGLSPHSSRHHRLDDRLGAADWRPIWGVESGALQWRRPPDSTRRRQRESPSRLPPPRLDPSEGDPHRPNPRAASAIRVTAAVSIPSATIIRAKASPSDQFLMRISTPPLRVLMTRTPSHFIVTTVTMRQNWASLVTMMLPQAPATVTLSSPSVIEFLAGDLV